MSVGYMNKPSLRNQLTIIKKRNCNLFIGITVTRIKYVLEYFSFEFALHMTRLEEFSTSHVKQLFLCQKHQCSSHNRKSSADDKSLNVAALVEELRNRVFRTQICDKVEPCVSTMLVILVITFHY